MFELAGGLALVHLELGDAAGLLEDFAAVLRAGAEDLVDPPLLHEGIGGGPDAGVHEEALDILEPAGGFIEEILALAGAEDTAGDGDLVEFGAEDGFAIGEGDVDLGHAEGFADIGAVEDTIFHLGAAEGAGAGFAQHPADGVGDVAFATAVGPDDGGEAGLELEPGFIGKTLEPRDIQPFQMHNPDSRIIEEKTGFHRPVQRWGYIPRCADGDNGILRRFLWGRWRNM
ncbi:MAG: hypothetical protein BWY09_02494 [Candidatus Hydrogenedentes bacterium ADurb.Bin179]|nr:MAG: hypothetical protein BWY09_02494 [Candidatus Hydrogenedentes bacterium ADurb.Bin179]